ncbi:hypothetical protein ACWERV_36435 [Streptomyces sp. NPDC004031]
MSADRTVAVWTRTTGCGVRVSTLTDDGRVHVTGLPPLGEPWFEGDDDPDYNPVCDCPRAPRGWCEQCDDCPTCAQCTHRT